MAYVAAKGGEKAIQQAEALYHEMKTPLSRDLVKRIEESMPALVERVMGEASLFAPTLAALALAQTGGDIYEAILLMRAYRSTQPRLAYAHTVNPDSMLTVRRISASFKDIPGGQILGPTLDYSHRLLKLDVLDQPECAQTEPVEPAETASPKHYSYVTDWERSQGLMEPLPETQPRDPADIPDLTREPLLFPAPREHRLQSFARAETGGILALGYANMRGYGGIHPTVNEVRLSYASVIIPHPVTGVPFSIGKVKASQAEIVSPMKGREEKPQLTLGFAATLGWNEVKVIAASMLDMAMDQPDPHPAHREEFVLYHTEAVESSGFCIHYKLPHYVTFNSDLDAMRNAMIAMGWLRDPNEETKSNDRPKAETTSTRA